MATALRTSGNSKSGLSNSNVKWNQKYTALLRATDQTAWGNWSLDGSVHPGAVGILNSQTGSFTHVATLPDFELDDEPAAAAVAIESEGVHRTSISADAKVGAGPIDVGGGFKWEFDEAGCLTSYASVVGRTSVRDFGRAIAAQNEWLRETAAEVGYTTADGNIVEGFGVITSVQRASLVLNMG